MSIKLLSNKTSAENVNNRLYQYAAKKKAISIIVSVFRYIFLISFSYVLLYPLFYMVVHSFQNPNDFLDPTVQWVPKEYTLENYKLAFEVLDFWSAFGTTLGTMILSAVIEVISCGIAAYGLARFKFKCRGILEALLMLNILVPTTMIIIPTYLNFKSMDFLGILGLISKIVGTELRPNLLDTPFVFYIPSIFGVGLQAGLFIYIFKQFFKGFPHELEEAASIDGAGPWATFFRIVVPSSGVAVLTVFIFSIIWHWNEYYQPAMFMNKYYPLAVKIHDFFVTIYSMGYNQYSAEAVNSAMAACVIFILPVLIMYMFLQRKFIESIAQTGIVG